MAKDFRMTFFTRSSYSDVIPPPDGGA